ncbi:hypothetical protein V1522DRAFT_409070 [Lipomyces starkeyi]
MSSAAIGYSTNPISNPMSRYDQYKSSRVSWGINVLGSFCVELEASDGQWSSSVLAC